MIKNKIVSSLLSSLLRYLPGSQSISRNLTLSLAAIVSVVVFFILVPIYVIQSNSLRHEIEERADDVISNFVKTITLPVWHYDYQYITEMGSVFAQNEFIEHIRLSDSSNRVFFEINKGKTRYPTIQRSMPLFHQNENIGSAFIRFTLKNYEEDKTRLFMATGITLLAAIIVILASTGFLLGRLLQRPLGVLTGWIDLISEGDFQYSFETMKQRELAHIAEKFTEMTDRVRSREKTLQDTNRKLTDEITERGRTEIALRAAEEKYRSIFENAIEGIFQTSQDGRYLSANPALAKMFGYATPEELLTAVKDVWTMHYVESHRKGEFLQLLAADGSVKNFEIPVYCKDGSTVMVSINARAIYDYNGEFRHIEGTAEDITEHKNAEDALRKSEDRFRLLTEGTPLGISLIGSDGIYKYLNPKFIELFGYTLEDIPTGRDWFSKAFPDKEKKHKLIAQWERDYNNGDQSGEANSIIINVNCKDGTQKVTKIQSVIMETGDFLITYEDMTEQKRLESQFQQAQKMEAVGTLAGGIAHDFNNLLMGIQGRTSLMLLDTEPSQPNYEHLKGIEQYVKSASDLTKQLLGFARGGKYEVKATDLNEVILKSSDLFGRTRKEIKIIRNLQSDIWTADVDSGQIEQVLLNLYVNAWQAMPDGGEIRIQTENVNIKKASIEGLELKPGRYIRISVTDTGVGIEEATQKRIFDPFFTTKEVGRGTGLGLASAYGIIKNHGGYIYVESEKGKGATFIIYLPASFEKIKKETKPDKKIFKGTGTVLVVDDEDMVLEINGQFLEKLGYQFFTAKSGLEALEVYEIHKELIILVILDMVMPDMNGGQVYDKLKEINPDVKVLLSSGYSIDEDASKIISRGCNGFIQKPFNMTELSEKIAEIFK